MKKSLIVLFIILMAFVSCKRQNKHIISPINITNAVKDSLLHPLMFDFSPVNKLNFYVKDSFLYMQFDDAKLVLPDTNYVGVDYYLQYVKFIFPSEHTVQGKGYDGEVQLYFKHNNDNAAVSFFIEKGDENPKYNPIIDLLERHKYRLNNSFKITLNLVDSTFYPRDLLPWTVNYWTYDGTFTDNDTTLRWFILKSPVNLSQKQLNVFKSISTHKPHKIKNSKVLVREF